MSVFVDTSALYSMLDAKDVSHTTSQQIWNRLLTGNYGLTSSSYVILETSALLQRRLGMDAVQDLHENIAPILDVQWVDKSLHQAGVAAMLTANRRQLSLVDCVSFEVCRRLAIRDVFAFDQHFSEQDFNVLTA